MLRRQGILLVGVGVLAVVALAVLGTGCSTQAPYPSKAIEMVIPYAPGGGADVMTRIDVKHLSPDLGVPVNVTNKGGGNQIPAVMYVRGAPADGYVLIGEAPGSTITHALLSDLPFKWDDRTFMSTTHTASNAYVVNGKSPWNSLKDVAEAVKKDPGSFTWGRLSGFTTFELLNLMFFDAAGVDVAKTKSVGFEGGGPMLTAIAGGHLMFGNVGTSAVFPLRSSGDIKVLAVAGPTREPSLPDVPTAKEAGFPSIDWTSYYMMSGPPGLPAAIVDRIDRAAKKITADPAYQKDMAAVGAQAYYAPADKTRELLLKQVDVFKSLKGRIAE